MWSSVCDGCGDADETFAVTGVCVEGRAGEYDCAGSSLSDTVLKVGFGA